MFDEFLRRAEELRNADERFAVAVVVRSEPPVSARPGYKAIIRADGTMWGWIGGGCTQPLVIKEAMASLKDGKPRLVRITPEGGSARDVGITEYTMTCHSGGALDVYVEPVLPRPHLVICGRSLVAQTLARLGAAIDYRVTVIAGGDGGGCFQTGDTVVERIEDCGVSITPDSFIVVATQGEDDEEALEQAAILGARYTAFVASRTKAGKVFDYLAGRGVSRERLGQIKAPAGLDIKATTPEEIAVSILAEIVEAKASKIAADPLDRGHTETEGQPTVGEDVVDGLEASHAGSVRSQEEKAGGTQLRQDLRARDPICGMEVDTEHARHRSEYDSRTFYFCCARCKEKFDQRPDQYVAAG
jgi:xanthine dehydrogenase accessory factor